MTRETAPTRRGFLAAVGGTVLAGCGGLPGGDDGRETISSHHLPDVTDDGDARPVVAEAIPVDIEEAKLRAAGRRVTDLVETLPLPLGPSHVPNGVVRERLLEAAADATTSLQDARRAQTPLSALESLRYARENARYAAAGWAFVDEGLTESALRAERRRAVTAMQSLQQSHEYRGRDVVRAALVHARIERNLDLVLADRLHPVRASNDLLTVAEWGERAESARVLAADTQYLSERFTASLPSDAGRVDGTLSAAAERLTEMLQRRRGDLPPEPTDDDHDVEWWLRYRLREAAVSSAERSAETDGPARAVLLGLEGLVNFLAFERIQRRLEDGEEFGVESAADVRAARSAAVDAIRTALERSPRSDLVRPVLADAAATVAYTDESLDRYEGEVSLSQLDDPVRRYTTATVRARSAPTACRHVLDALR